MGPDRTAVAGERTTRRPVARPPRGGERHPVEAAYGGSLARPARALRTLANLLRGDAQTKSDADGEVEWLVSVDSTIARAHQHAAGARRRPSKEDVKKGGLASRGRGARAQPRRSDDQAASGLRRQGPAAVGGRDPGPAPREHPARGGTRRDTCEAPRWSRAAEQA